MRKKITVFLTMLFLCSVAWQSECVAAENLVITTFYPSPAGEYYLVDVSGHAVVQPVAGGAAPAGEMTLDVNGILENQVRPNPPTIASNGLMTVPNFYSNATTYVKSLRAYEFDVTPARINSPNWQVLNWHTDYTFWQLLPLPVSTINCGSGFVNSLDVVSGVLPICIAIPIHLPLVLVICTGQEVFNWDYSCINP